MNTSFPISHYYLGLTESLPYSGANILIYSCEIKLFYPTFTSEAQKGRTTYIACGKTSGRSRPSDAGSCALDLNESPTHKGSTRLLSSPQDPWLHPSFEN